MVFRRFWQPAFAVLACAALVYLVAGAAFVHKHHSGPEIACHICQAIHMPALAAAAGLELFPVPGPIGWYPSLLLHAAPLDSFALHSASRAPPAA